MPRRLMPPCTKIATYNLVLPWCCTDRIAFTHTCLISSCPVYLKHRHSLLCTFCFLDQPALHQVRVSRKNKTKHWVVSSKPITHPLWLLPHSWQAVLHIYSGITIANIDRPMTSLKEETCELLLDSHFSSACQTGWSSHKTMATWYQYV